MFEKNAKTAIIFFIASSFFLPIYGNVMDPEKEIKEKINIEAREDELIIIDRMIELTKQQQQAQKRLKNLIVDLQHNKEIFMKNGESKLHAFYMVRAASESLRIIRKYHLEHLFSSDFLAELALFDKIGMKDTPTL